MQHDTAPSLVKSRLGVFPSLTFIWAYPRKKTSTSDQIMSSQYVEWKWMKHWNWNNINKLDINLNCNHCKSIVSHHWIPTSCSNTFLSYEQRRENISEQRNIKLATKAVTTLVEGLNHKMYQNVCLPSCVKLQLVPRYIHHSKTKISPKPGCGFCGSVVVQNLDVKLWSWRVDYINSSQIRRSWPFTYLYYFARSVEVSFPEDPIINITTSNLNS